MSGNSISVDPTSLIGKVLLRVFSRKIRKIEEAQDRAYEVHLFQLLLQTINGYHPEFDQAALQDLVGSVAALNDMTGRWGGEHQRPGYSVQHTGPNAVRFTLTEDHEL